MCAVAKTNALRTRKSTSSSNAVRSSTCVVAKGTADDWTMVLSLWVEHRIFVMNYNVRAGEAGTFAGRERVDVGEIGISDFKILERPEGLYNEHDPAMPSNDLGGY